MQKCNTLEVITTIRNLKPKLSIIMFFIYLRCITVGQFWLFSSVLVGKKLVPEKLKSNGRINAAHLASHINPQGEKSKIV
jgi:hypothetical protein